MKPKRLMALVTSLALTTAYDPFVHLTAQVAAPAVPSQPAIQAAALNISGTVVGNDRKIAVAAACLRLRNLNTNAIVDRAVSGGTGEFSFSASGPGTYLVEVVDCNNGSVLAVSDVLNLGALPVRLTTVVVLPSAVKAGFFSSTAVAVLAAASAAGVTVFALRAGGSTPAVSSPEQ